GRGGQAAVRIRERAAELEPDSPLVHAALAEAWTNLGSDRRARQEAEKAFEISSSLGDEERNWIEGRYREAMQDWPRAIRVYGELRGAYPDNCEYGLRLAGAQRSLSAPGDALVTLAALRRLPGAAEDPRIDLAEADARQDMADFTRARQLASVAAAKATRLGARQLLARALLREALALDRLGDYPQAAARYAEAHRFFAATGDTASGGWAQLSL